MSKIRCYAACLGGCSAKQSKEHFISRAILEVINANNAMMVSGVFGSGVRESKPLAPSALTAKVLCTTHNTLLSPVDKGGLVFFKTCLLVHEPLRQANRQPAPLWIDGRTVERWMLKTLCGMWAAGMVRDADGRALSRTPPEHWVRQLYGDAPWPRELGLLAAMVPGESSDTRPGVRFEPLMYGDQVAGVIITFVGIRFILPLGRVPVGAAGSMFEHTYQRPTRIHFQRTSTASAQDLNMSWGLAAPSNELTVTWD